jgi:hypothetical protein
MGALKTTERPSHPVARAEVARRAACLVLVAAPVAPA